MRVKLVCSWLCVSLKFTLVKHSCSKGKGEFRPGRGYEGPQGGVEAYLCSFFNLGARWGSVVNATRRPLYPWEGDSSYRRLGGPQDRSGQVRKISPPQEFDPRTVRPVASRFPGPHSWSSFTVCAAEFESMQWYRGLRCGHFTP
jgi:hypothetical protein